MATSSRQLEAKILELPPRQRARLAERLISSLDEEADVDAEAAWIREGERRLDELNSGKANGRAAAGVFRRASRWAAVSDHQDGARGAKDEREKAP